MLHRAVPLLALLLALPAGAAPLRLADPVQGAALRQGIARGHAVLRVQQRLAQLPRIAIVIDDLGDSAAPGWRTVDLPGPVACAFLPAGPFTGDQALRAHERGKEVLLHLPLQPHSARAPRPPGLDADSDAADYRTFLRGALAAVPWVRGVNNHQGSLSTEHPGAMDLLMAELEQRGLYFLDSRTSTRSVAFRSALGRGLPAVRRHVFLDASREPAAIRAAFLELVALAKRHGQALAIGHPNRETLALLERELPRLERHGVQLVAPSALVDPTPRPRLRLSPALDVAAARVGPRATTATARPGPGPTSRTARIAAIAPAR